MEPIKHSIDRKTNSANIDNHDSNDIDTTSLDDRKNKTETPAPLLEILDARDVEPDRGNGVIENFDMTSEEMVPRWLDAWLDPWLDNAQLSEY